MFSSALYLFILIILAVLLPVNGILSGKRISEFLSRHPEGRLIFYRQTIVIQIVLAALVLAAMAYNRDPVSVIGFSFLTQPLQLAGLLAACFLGWWLLLLFPFDPQKLRREIEKNAAIKFLLPATEEEYRWSLGVSLAAGIGEEIVFRGFLYWQLSQWLAVAPAILLTNLIFGLCHYGSGIKNASLAFAMGVLLSLLLLYTESLWWLMLIHVLVDVYSMTKGKRYFESDPGVGEGFGSDN